VLLEAHRRLGGFPRLMLAGRVLDDTPLDISGEVKLRGLLDHPSVIDLMRTACVVFVPSIVHDCCPIVVLEAMAVIRPVVAAASEGIVDLVDDGVTGQFASQTASSNSQQQSCHSRSSRESSPLTAPWGSTSQNNAGQPAHRRLTAHRPDAYWGTPSPA